MENRLSFMRGIIQKIGAFQHTHFRTAIEFETKAGPMDTVSFVDRECEKMFIEAVNESFPGDVIMGEETFNSDHDYRKHDKLWIIDPLDGTLMYQRGILCYGPMIAYVENGVVQFSAIYLPEINELYHADKTGSYRNGKPIHVSRAPDLENALVNISNTMLKKMKKTPEKIMEFFSAIAKMTHFYSAATVTTYCASSSIDGGFFSMTTGNIWDTIPGCFLIQQAGGKVTNFGSESWDIFNPNVIFSNGCIHAEFQKLLES